MPRPAYILCYGTHSIDKDTNLTSLFGIVEKLQLTQFSIPDGVSGAIIVEKPPFHVTAVWLLNPNDNPGDEYEYEMTLTSPENETTDLARGKFYFVANKPFHRFNLNIQGPLPLKSAGLLFVECKIRKTGDTGWLRQNYPIVVEIGPPTKLFSTDPKEDLSTKAL